LQKPYLLFIINAIHTHGGTKLNKNEKTLTRNSIKEAEGEIKKDARKR